MSLINTRTRNTLVAASTAVLLLSSCSGTDANGSDGGTSAQEIIVSGGFGDEPGFEWPQGDPSGELEVVVLEEGDGPEVSPGATVVANYAGHVWHSDEPFDSSYERSEPSQFSLDFVVAGWQEGIPGNNVGSRLLLSVPPEDGYGSQGRPEAGIGGEDTMVFVVDVLGAYDIDSMGQRDAESVELPDSVPVVVEGELGERVEVSVAEGASDPEEPAVYPLSMGDGQVVEAGDQVVFSYAMTSWDNEVKEASWMEELGPEAGPQTIPVGVGTVLDLVEGYPVGSRLLMVHTSGSDFPAMAVVADIIASF